MFYKRLQRTALCLFWILAAMVSAQFDHHRRIPLHRSRHPYSPDVRFHDGSALSVNDDCVDSRLNRPGICQLASECLSVQLEFKQTRRNPTICSYQNNDLVVCCPIDASQQQQQQRTTQPPEQPPTFSWSRPEQQQPPVASRPNSVASNSWGTTDNVVFGEAPVRKSQEKCDEYAALAIHKASFTPLSILGSVDEVSIPNCAYPTGLIVGGIKTNPGEFPHMAALGWSEVATVKWNCGGTLISDQYVMTAGHCASVRGVRPDIVRLGDQNLVRNDDRARPQDFGVSDVIAHPDYRHASHYNDIAVIKLNSRVRFNKFIRPACLWQNYDVNSTKGVATGWGQVEYGGEKSDELLKVSLDFVDNAICSTRYEPSKRIRSGIVDSQICAGVLSGGRDTCQGDSGGPIQVLTPRNQCIFHIVGVTSFGRACAARNSVGVYTRVSSHLDWLESVVWP